MSKVIGMDLGDKRNVAVVFSEDGEELGKGTFANTSKQVQRFFTKYPGAVVVMEAGTHSPWISRLLKSMGHEVLVGNPRKLRMIWGSNQKDDTRDARALGLMYRLEPRLLHPVYHRSEEAQMDLTVIKARMQLVQCRSKLVTYVRSAVKGVGQRLPSCSAAAFAKRAKGNLPEGLEEVLAPMLEIIEELTQKIRQHDYRIKQLSEERYPETGLLRQVPGVGPITALTYFLTLEEPSRFDKSREV